MRWHAWTDAARGEVAGSRSAGDGRHRGRLGQVRNVSALTCVMCPRLVCHALLATDYLGGLFSFEADSVHGDTDVGIPSPCAMSSTTSAAAAVPCCLASPLVNMLLGCGSEADRRLAHCKLASPHDTEGDSAGDRVRRHRMRQEADRLGGLWT